MLLKEQFRTALKQHNWSGYQTKIVAVYCSTDAILPQWAYMLIAAQLQPYTNEIYFGTPTEVEKKLLLQNIQAINNNQYKNEK